ncbi:hypothetical protein ACN47E_007053 [Coniothyrium glycines]
MSTGSIHVLPDRSHDQFRSEWRSAFLKSRAQLEAKKRVPSTNLTFRVCLRSHQISDKCINNVNHLCTVILRDLNREASGAASMSGLGSALCKFDCHRSAPPSTKYYRRYDIPTEGVLPQPYPHPDAQSIPTCETLTVQTTGNYGCAYYFNLSSPLVTHAKGHGGHLNIVFVLVYLG